MAEKCDRKQVVKIDECSSNLLGVSCGVPQGSVLGPKLFILYINSICNVSQLLKFVLFVDDTNIYILMQMYLILDALLIAVIECIKIQRYGLW